MKDNPNKDRTSEFYYTHSIMEKEEKKPINIFSAKMLIVYFASSFIIWETFFTILPKVLYDKNEGWMSYISIFWKGYNVLLVKNPMLCSCGVTLFTTSLVFIMLTLFYLLMFGDDA